MKKLLLILLIPISLFGQEFTFSTEGLTDYVVINVEGKKQKELYDKAKLWIMDTYSNPSEVIKVDLENEKLRIEGTKQGYSRQGPISIGAKYKIEISFRDGRYKFDPIQLEHIIDGGIYDSFVDKENAYFNKKGEPKKVYKTTVEAIPSLFNDLNTSLYNYIIKEKKEEDW